MGSFRGGDEDPAPAAVLLPVYKKMGEYNIIFTKRSEKTTYHAGEISFPGGSYEEEDGNLVNTALRESCEEIGLSPHDVRIIGELEQVRTLTSSYLVTPYVGIIPYPYDFRINKDEVVELIHVPISALLASEKRDRWIWGDHLIWGATARILDEFLSFVPSIE